MKLRSPVKAHLTRLTRICDGMMRKIRLAIGTLTWIMRFDGNGIALDAYSTLTQNNARTTSELRQRGKWRSDGERRECHWQLLLRRSRLFSSLRLVRRLELLPLPAGGVWFCECRR